MTEHDPAVTYGSYLEVDKLLDLFGGYAREAKGFPVWA